jgi:photoactive yellow protein
MLSVGFKFTPDILKEQLTTAGAPRHFFRLVAISPQRINQMKNSSLKTKLPFGLLELNTAGDVIRYSPASEQFSEVQARDVLGRHFFREVLPEGQFKDFQSRFQLFMLHGQTVDRFSASFDSEEGLIKVQVLLAKMTAQSGQDRLALVRLMPDGN